MWKLPHAAGGVVQMYNRTQKMTFNKTRQCHKVKIQGKLFVDEDAETFGTEVRETEDETVRRRRRTKQKKRRATMAQG